MTGECLLAREFVSQYTKCIVTGEEVGLVCMQERRLGKAEGCVMIQILYRHSGCLKV